MAISGLMNILSTSGPYACLARIVLRKREEDKLRLLALLHGRFLAAHLLSYEMSLPSSATYESRAVELDIQ